MARPKSEQKKDADLRFRAELLLRLRLKRLAIFYGGNASAMMRNKIAVHLDAEEERLGTKNGFQIEPVLQPTYASYEALPRPLQEDVLILSDLIKSLIHGEPEPNILRTYDYFFPNKDSGIGIERRRAFRAAQAKSAEQRKVESSFRDLENADTRTKTTAKKKVGILRDILEVSLSVFGTIPAGFPDHRRAIKPKRTVMVPKGKYPANAFGLDVVGDSMNTATGKLGPILSGETVVLVTPDLREPKHGDIVAALCDGQTTLKRLSCKPKPCVLRAESTNPAFANSIRPAHELVIQGVVIGKL